MHSQMARFITWMLVIITPSSLLGVHAQTDCGAHGTWSNNRCVCTNTTPALGQTGYVGAACEIAVYGVDLNGSDMMRSCSAAECGRVKPKDWVCFYATLPSQWNYLALEQTRVSDDGDPDLYGMFDFGDAARHPTGGGGAHGDMPTGGGGSKETHSSSSIPTSDVSAFDFQETSSGLHPRVTLRVSHAEATAVQPKTPIGVWLCVHAYGKTDINVSMRGQVTQCPSTFTPSGLEQCSSPGTSPTPEGRYDTCTDNGRCVCRGEYARPTNTTVKDLGFEDCSARVVQLEDYRFVEGHERRAEILDQHCEPGTWLFYAFNVSDRDYQVEVGIDEEDTQEGLLEVYLKYGAPPSFHYGEWDFSRGWTMDYFFDVKENIVFDRTSDLYRTGTWFIGLYCEHYGGVNYTLAVNKFTCPMQCNGHGQCSEENQCLCDTGFTGVDCSVEHTTLSFDTPLTQDPAFFEYEHFTLPRLDARLRNRSIEVQVEVWFYFSANGDAAAIKSLSKPELLLLQGDEDSIPNVHNYTMRHMLHTPNTSYHVTLSATQATEGVWHAALFNPGALWDVGFGIVIHKITHCPANCNDHGHCSEDGECQCQDGWSGADCSVQPGATNCQAGTMQPVLQPERLGTCWHACTCKGSGADQQCGYDTSTCASFTCDAPGQMRVRVGGDGQKCVVDECVEATWVAHGEHGVCRRTCTCDANGDGCRLASTCTPGSVVCAEGFVVLQAQGEGVEEHCVPEQCSHGSVEEVSIDGLAHVAKAFAACRCQATNGSACLADATNPQLLLLVCRDGYLNQGGQWDPAVGALVGGTCVASSSSGGGGAPAWVVAVVVLIALVVGAGSAVGGLWVWENKLHQVPTFEGKGLYQELSGTSRLREDVGF